MPDKETTPHTPHMRNDGRGNESRHQTWEEIVRVTDELLTDLGDKA